MNAVTTIFARLMIALIFIMSALGNKIPNFTGVANYMAGEGVPFPKFALIGAIVFLIVGSLSVIAGYRTRVGAGMLLFFLAAATWYFHDFWTFEGEAQQQQMIQFLKNVSLMGTMLLLMANGPGKAGLDGRHGRSSELSSEA